MAGRVRAWLSGSWGWLRDKEPLIISGMIAAFFLAGYWGYLQVLPELGSTGRALYLDAIYSAIKLFIFNGPDVTENWPALLQLVRILAPFLLIYTAVKTLWTHAGEHLALFLLRFHYRRFVVVCGVGETGYRIALQYLENSHSRVVLIDDQRMNPRVASLRALGAIALLGDALDSATLSRARMHAAREVFVFSGSDEKNIAIGKIIHRLVRAKRQGDGAPSEVAHRGERLRCHIQVDAPAVAEIFQDHPFFNLIDERLELRIFNRDVSVARNIMDKCAPDLYYRPESGSDARMSALFLGFGSLSQALLIQYALTAHYADLRKPLATVLCHESCRKAVEQFRQRFANIDEVVELVIEFVDPETLSPEYWANLLAQTRYRVCYTALPHDVDSILAARRLNRMRNALVAPPIHFVICLNQQSWIADVVDDDFLPIDTNKAALSSAAPFEYFETLDETITIEVVVNDALDQLAVAIHDCYLQSQRQACNSVADNPSVVEWRYLPLYKKVANQRAAAHLEVKLRIAGCSRTGSQEALPTIEFPADPDSLEMLAKVEHQRWCADKHLAGYSYGEIRDDSRFLHPDLKPWSRLSEVDKEKDRAIIRQIPRLLELIGQKVVADTQTGQASPKRVLREEAGA